MKQQLIVILRNKAIFSFYDTFAAAQEALKSLQEKDPENKYSIDHAWRQRSNPSPEELDKWKVHIKGAPNKYFEICVIKESNIHGHRSYGWFNERKLLISSSGGPCNDTVSELVWNKLLKVAQEVADELNNMYNRQYEYKNL